MIVRNASGAALARPEDITWPTLDTSSAPSLDASYLLLAGSVVDLSLNNSATELQGSVALATLISAGDLVRVVGGADVDASVPLSVAVNPDGFADYNNAGGALALDADTWVTLTNDGAGGYTNLTYMPPGVARLVDTSTGALDFSDLALGDELLVRQDIAITPAVNGAQVEMRVKLGSGGGEYYLTYRLGTLNQGAAVAYPLNQNLPLYMGDANTLGAPGVVQVRCSEAASVVNNGSYITLKRSTL